MSCPNCKGHNWEPLMHALAYCTDCGYEAPSALYEADTPGSLVCEYPRLPFTREKDGGLAFVHARSYVHGGVIYVVLVKPRDQTYYLPHAQADIERVLGEIGYDDYCTIIYEKNHFYLIRIGYRRGVFSMDTKLPWLTDDKLKELLGEMVPVE